MHREPNSSLPIPNFPIFETKEKEEEKKVDHSANGNKKGYEDNYDLEFMQETSVESQGVIIINQIIE